MHHLLFIDFDKKRIVYKLQMIHKIEKYVAATSEVCSLYVDLNTRRVTEFEESKKIDHTSAVKKFEFLKNLFPDQVLLLHGKTQIIEKEKIAEITVRMMRFDPTRFSAEP